MLHVLCTYVVLAGLGIVGEVELESRLAIRCRAVNLIVDALRSVCLTERQSGYYAFGKRVLCGSQLSQSRPTD